MSTLARVSDVDVQDATETDSVGGVLPRLVARPTSTEQVSQLLSAAAEDGLVVVPRGRGTKLRWGVPPRSVDVLLDLSGMDRVLEHQAGDLIVAAEAGTPLAAMQDTCARADQRLAIDELVPGTTIGGLIATNLSGPRRMAYGTMRDLLIGVTVVRPDGVVAKAGGKVVKNVAGYDLGKLMTGSFGTLAVVTSAFFRLHPVPETSTWVSVEAESPSAATETVRQAVHSQMVPAAVEIDAQPGRPTLVSALLEGTEVGVAGRVDQLLRLWGDTAAVDTQERPRGFPRESESQALLKLTCAISAVPEIAQAAVDLGLHVRGSAGTGVLFAALPDGTPPETVASALERLRERTTAAGGAAVLLDAPPEISTAVDAWGPVPGIELMRRVKERFDPENLLSPGRFVGGI